MAGWIAGNRSFKCTEKHSGCASDIYLEVTRYSVSLSRGEAWTGQGHTHTSESVQTCARRTGWHLQTECMTTTKSDCNQCPPLCANRVTKPNFTPLPAAKSRLCFSTLGGKRCNKKKGKNAAASRWLIYGDILFRRSRSVTMIHRAATCLPDRNNFLQGRTRNPNSPSDFLPTRNILSAWVAHPG